MGGYAYLSWIFPTENKQATGLDLSSETWTHDDCAGSAGSPLLHPSMAWGVTKSGGVAE